MKDRIVLVFNDIVKIEKYVVKNDMFLNKK